MEVLTSQQLVSAWLYENIGQIRYAVDRERLDMIAQGLDISKGNFCAGLFKYFDRDLLPETGRVRVINVFNKMTGVNTTHSVFEIEDRIVDPTYSQFKISPDPSDLQYECLVVTRQVLSDKYGLDYSF